MSIYENVRAMWTQHTGRTTDASISMLENCMIGSIVDGMTAWATNPFDVIKSRLMNQARSRTSGATRGRRGVRMQAASCAKS